MSKGVTIYFMRHAETYLNRYHRMQGWADAPLTPQGISDAVRSAKGLKDIEFAAVYSSDLQRTVSTAEIILKYNVHHRVNPLTIEKRPEFREVFFGSFEGLEAQPIWDKVGEYVSNSTGGYQGLANSNQVRLELDAFHEKDPYHEAENFMQFWSRIELGLIDVIAKHRETDRNILVVSHGVTIRNMIHELIPDFKIESLLDNGSVSIVRYQEGLYHLDAYNQTEHFAIEEAAQTAENLREAHQEAKD